MEPQHYFESPIRRYTSQRLNLSFNFGREFLPREVETFEFDGGKYRVVAVEFYLKEEEAKKEGKVLDKSRELKPESGFFLSSSWLEILYGDDEYDCEGHLSGCDEDEIADELIDLDGSRNLFSYDCPTGYISDLYSMIRDHDDYLYFHRDLNQDEVDSLDKCIRKRLDEMNALP